MFSMSRLRADSYPRLKPFRLTSTQVERAMPMTVRRVRVFLRSRLRDATCAMFNMSVSFHGLGVINEHVHEDQVLLHGSQDGGEIRQVFRAGVVQDGWIRKVGEFVAHQ